MISDDGSSDTIEYDPNASFERETGRRGQRQQARGQRRQGRGTRTRGVRRGRGDGRGRGVGRGRGQVTRGRGRGGRRGRGRGRGQTDRISSGDKERVEQMKKERKKQIKDTICTMPTEELRELILKLVEREPGLIFDLCEGAGAPDMEPPQDPAHQRLPSWCKCLNCREMPTDLERKCCNCFPRNCISQRIAMETLVLDPQVLALGNAYHRDMLGRHGQPVENYNKSMRHSAYRNFTLWRHGRLGEGIRRVIPSCCVWRVRDTFPDVHGVYTGFVPGRFA